MLVLHQGICISKADTSCLRHERAECKDTLPVCQIFIEILKHHVISNLSNQNLTICVLKLQKS